MPDKANSARVFTVLKSGSLAGLKTSWVLLGIMVPVSLAVAVLNWTGALSWLAGFLSPAMRLIGLPGEAALVLASSFFLSNYSAIAVMETLSLSLREITILALMCLLAHGLIVESAVMKKTGSSLLKIVLLRLGAAIFAAWALNSLLPPDTKQMAASKIVDQVSFLSMLGVWAIDTGLLMLKVMLLVILIMIIQKMLEEFGLTARLSKSFAPLMKFFGLPEELSFLWIVINIVGYAYGAGIIIDQAKGGKMKLQNADLLNHHAAMSHSLFEDTALYIALGVPFFWITVPRLLLAIVVVWLERLRRYLFRRSFKVGTA